MGHNMTDVAYNGWTNYETWVTALWLGNEQYSYDTWRQAARSAAEDNHHRPGMTVAEAATIIVADQLKDHHEDAMHSFLEEANMTCSLWTDLLRSALSEVNWYEIAEHIIYEVLEEQEAQEGTT